MLCQEEIGLNEADVEVVCCMPPIVNKFKVRVHPVIGIVTSGIQLTANPTEVADILYMTIPLQR